MNSTPQADKDNWFRFDGDSTEPEWDLETDVDDCEEDTFDDVDLY